jgi:hypothetical protein
LPHFFPPGKSRKPEKKATTSVLSSFCSIETIFTGEVKRESNRPFISKLNFGDESLDWERRDGLSPCVFEKVMWARK